jgi:hypothetical protein
MPGDHRLDTAVPNGGYVRVQEDAAHLGIDTSIGVSGRMNIRCCPVPQCSLMPPSRTSSVAAQVSVGRPECQERRPVWASKTGRAAEVS